MSDMNLTDINLNKLKTENSSGSADRRHRFPRAVVVLFKLFCIAGLALFCGCAAVVLDNAAVLKRAGNGSLVDISAIGSSEFLGTESLDIKPVGNGEFILDRQDAGDYTAVTQKSGPWYIERLRFRIVNETGRPARIKLRISYGDQDGDIAVRDMDELQPIYVSDVVCRLRQDNTAEIRLELLDKLDSLPDPGLRLEYAYVDNTLCLNRYRLAFGFLVGLTIGALLFFGCAFVKRPELAFLLLMLTVGGFMSVSMPLNKIGFDEEAHIQAVADMAAFPGGELHISDQIMYQMMITEYNNPDAQPSTHEEHEAFNHYLAEYCDYKSGNRSPDFVTLSNRKPAYLSMAVMMKLCKGLDLSWDKVLIMTRLANMLMYTALMFFAIALLTQGKWLMLLIGLLPENIFLASTFSYDPFVTAAICLGYALCMRAVSGCRRGPAGTDKSFRLGYLYLGFAALFIFLGCLPKAVYAPLILLMLMVPEESFASKRDRHIYSLLVCVLFVVLIASFILPTVVAPSETGDARGGATSEVSQVGYILQNPIGYAMLLIRQMIEWIPQCFFGADCTTFMGHLVNGSTEFKGFYQPILLMLTVSFFVNDIRRPADLGQSAFAVLVGGASCVLVWTSMYVAFTEPGAAEIAGVQGRYFIPYMFPLYFIVASFCTFLLKMLIKPVNKGLSGDSCLETIRPVWYYIMTILTAVVLWLTVYKVIISTFLV